MTPDIWFPNLGLEFYNLSRRVFTVFGFAIYWYAVFVIAGVMAGYVTALIEAKRTGQRQEDYMDLLFAGVVSAVIGLRLFYVAFNWDSFRDNPIRIITGFRDGGLAIYGGIIASIIAVYLFSKVRKLNVWTILDTCAPSFAIGQVIGRWGNFFNREAFGGFTDNLFAMRMVREQTTMPLSSDILANTIIYQGVEYIQVHPTFLYESVWNLGVFILLTWYRPHKKFNGEVFWLYLTGYGLGRFLIEGLRTDQLLLGSMPVSQMMAALSVISGLAAVSYFRLISSQKQQ